jgi:Putative auto-transporter adhesin, head GIN domain
MTPVNRARAAALATVLTVPLLIVGCIQGTGPIVTETRDVRPFTRLEVGSGIRVALTIGDAGPLRVSAQHNVLPAVATEVSGNTLRVDASEDFAGSAPVTVTVSTPVLEAVSMSGGAQATIGVAGSGTLGVAGSGTLELAVNGGSQLTVTGTAAAVSLSADGGSTVWLDDLTSASVEVHLSGGAIASVMATGRVSGSASGGAHLSVAGGGPVDVDTSSGAQVARDAAS